MVARGVGARAAGTPRVRKGTRGRRETRRCQRVRVRLLVRASWLGRRRTRVMKGRLAGMRTVARRRAVVRVSTVVWRHAVTSVSTLAWRHAVARVSTVAWRRRAVASVRTLARSRVVTSVSVVGPKAALSLKIAVGSRVAAGLQEAVDSRAAADLKVVAVLQEAVASKGVAGLQEAADSKGVAGPQEVVASRAGLVSGRRAPKAAPGVTLPLGVSSTVGRAAGRAGSLTIVRVGRRRVKAALGIVAARESSGGSNTGAMGLGGVEVLAAAVTQAVGFVLGREARVRGARVRGAGLAGQVASSLARVRRVSGSRKLPGTDSANLG